MKIVAFVRGAFFNQFEGQTYEKIDSKQFDITALTSLHPLHSTWKKKILKIPSLYDLSTLPILHSELGKKLINGVANRCIGDSQLLFGLEKYSNEFDLFHTADSHYYYSYQLAKLRAENKIKLLLVTSWETVPFSNETVRRKKQIKKFTMSYADHFLCYTEKAKKTLTQENVDSNKISVVKLGVDLDTFHPKNQTSKSKSVFTILFVGRLVEEKGILDLYEVFKQLKRNTVNQKIQLNIIGDGPLKLQLINLIKNDTLEHWVQIESKDYNEMPDIYRNADCIVVPSKHTQTWEEQYGMVLVEAMASGLPIIAYNSGAIKEIVGDVIGLVNEGNKKDLFNQIIMLIQDKKKLLQLSSSLRKRAETFFDRRQSALEIGRIYKMLCNRITSE